jgi:superfamily II DNA or RNA helicase
MVTLKIQNDYSWVLTKNEDLKKELWLGLRKREKGYFHSTLYKQGIWDGFVEFFHRDGGRFLTGLLPEVLRVLKKHEITPEIVDTREFFEWKYKRVGPKFLKQWAPDDKQFNLHDYQIEGINSVIRNYRGIIKYPTGAGKTAIMIGILKSLPDKCPVLFLTKGASLVEQNYKDMIEYGIPNVGRVYGKHKEPNFITCATTNKQTLMKLKNLLPKYKVLIVDEVHDCMSKIPKTAYKKLSGCVARIGISATPFKHGGKDVTQKFYTKGFFGPILKTKGGVVTTKRLQDRNILSKSECHFFRVEEPKLIHEPYLDAVTMGIAENFTFLDMVKKLTVSLKGRNLILVDRIAQGEALEQMIPNSYWISGPTQLDERGEIFQKLKYDENATAIVMQQIVSAGINVFVHNLINAAGGKAIHSIIQRMGRGLRKAGDKDILKYYDFIFDINDYLYKHSCQRIDTLTKEGHKIIRHEKFNL